jgi:bifunctional non-homologous end joining protein LigD
VTCAPAAALSSGIHATIAESIAKLGLQTLSIDGEIVALDDKGLPSFQLLQGSGSVRPTIVFYAFELLWLNGEDFRGLL